MDPMAISTHIIAISTVLTVILTGQTLMPMRTSDILYDRKLLIGLLSPAKPLSQPSDVPIPIAIIGMGMTLPGGCHDAENSWDFLMNKKEGMVPVPSTRWNADGFHDPAGKPGTIKANEGNFLNIDLGAFDAGFFSMTAAQIEQADPQQRVLLETVYESVVNSGERNIKGRNIGGYVGLFAEVSGMQSCEKLDLG